MKYLNFEITKVRITLKKNIIVLIHRSFLIELVACFRIITTSDTPISRISSQLHPPDSLHSSLIPLLTRPLRAIMKEVAFSLDKKCLLSSTINHVYMKTKKILFLSLFFFLSVTLFTLEFFLHCTCVFILLMFLGIIIS